MAIRVTKQGSLPELDVFAGACQHCKTEVEFERRDARFSEDQRDGAFLTVDCPTCNGSIHVSAGKPTRSACR